MLAWAAGGSGREDDLLVIVGDGEHVAVDPQDSGLGVGQQPRPVPAADWPRSAARSLRCCPAAPSSSAASSTSAGPWTTWPTCPAISTATVSGSALCTNNPAPPDTASTCYG